MQLSSVVFYLPKRIIRCWLADDNAGADLSLTDGGILERVVGFNKAWREAFLTPLFRPGGIKNARWKSGETRMRGRDAVAEATGWLTTGAGGGGIDNVQN